MPPQSPLDIAGPLSATLNIIVPSLMNAISLAVVESLKSIEIVPVEDCLNSDPAAAVQGSVVAASSSQFNW